MLTSYCVFIADVSGVTQTMAVIRKPNQTNNYNPRYQTPQSFTHRLLWLQYFWSLLLV